MAKKARRVRRKKRANRPSGKNKVGTGVPQETVDPQMAKLEPSTENMSKAKGKGQVKLTDEEELREEYAYVIDDLRRIAILAAALFALLILLNILL